ncbi:MAG TPA: sugar ABC transporter permease [Brevefilum sp.]|nr:sugar ABC transporter permease [Brevefilum sp.]HPL69025.1 sugar ABC transporter permease [Brevefilum sp.]
MPQSQMQNILSASRTQTGFSNTAGKRKRAIKNFLEAMLYLSPALILFIAFVFIPLIRSFQISAYITDPIGRLAKFVGLLNYQRLFETPNFINSLKKSFIFVLYNVPTTIAISLGLALLGDLRLKGIPFFRMVFSVAIAISGATASLMFKYIYHPTVGINYLLSLVGIPNIPWLVSSNTALISVALTSVWLQIGMNTVIILAAMQTIPEELYESAMIDGANAWNKFVHITLPMLSSTFFFLLVVNTLASFQTFTPIHIMTSGGPLESTNLLVYSIYREFYFNGKFGFAAAQSIMLFFIMLILTIFQFVFLERKVHYE